jgi:hypothetical protein
VPRDLWWMKATAVGRNPPAVGPIHANLQPPRTAIALDAPSLDVGKAADTAARVAIGLRR